MTKHDNRPMNPADLRQKAEALAREQADVTSEDSAALSPEEIRKTLHELRVHQIELEMQNEELRRAQVQLEAGRARYYNLYDLAPIGYCTLSEKGLILEANLTAATMLGIARSELVQQPISRFILKEDQDVYYLHRKKLFEAGEPQECELRLVKPDGACFWAHLMTTAAKAEDGTPVCRVVLNDITERKTFEKDLKRYRELIEKAESVARVGAWEWDLRSDHWTFSNEWLRIHGRSQHTASTAELMHIAHPDDIETIDACLRAAFDEGKPYDLEHRIIREADGEIRWVHARGELTRDEDERPIILRGAAQDITEKKQAERNLLRQQRSLELHNRIANVFLTSSGDDIYSDVLDVILGILDSRFGYFGYIDEAGDLVCPSLTRDVWDNCQVAEKSIVFPRSSWGGLWGRSLMEKRTLVAYENLRLPEGHVVLDNALAVPIVHYDILIGQFVVANKSGRYTRDDQDLLESAAVQTAPILFGIQEKARQETAKAKLQEQLNQTQKMESVGRLAGGVAHDFNNMLNVILGRTELVLENLAADNPLRDDLDEIRKAAERSANLTRQLLGFARRQTVTPRVLDLNETIASMLKMLERLIGEDIDLNWKPGSRLDLVRIDSGQVDQILANLAVNARDAIGNAIGKLCIETANVSFDEEYCAAHAEFQPGDYVMLAVSDDGSGMDEETRVQIFEPFFTTKEVGQGTGLGLSTIYGIVKQNNGFVNVSSELGKGSTFYIYLPALKADSRRNEDALASGASPAGGTETILIVEDEAAILNLIRMMLERLGYTILTAGGPSEARRVAHEQQGKIDLLITDVVMPEMNGRDLARSMHEYCPHIRCLFMLGYTANLIAHQGVLDDGVNFISKPFSPRDLARKVREALDM